MTTMIQDKDGKTAAAPSTMPSDRHFRNAWVFDSAQSAITEDITCLLYTSPSPRDSMTSRMPSSA